MLMLLTILINSRILRDVNVASEEALYPPGTPNNSNKLKGTKKIKKIKKSANKNDYLVSKQAVGIDSTIEQ
jgi:hypothetical protein